MNNEITEQIKARSHHLERAKQLASKVPRLRTWALTDAHLLGLAALSKAIAAESPSGNSKSLEERFVAAVEDHEPHVPGLFQSELLEPQLPKPLRDPVTNSIIDKLPDNATERALMKRRFPAWFDYLTRKETHPISVITDHEDAKAAYQIEKEFRENYDHKSNPWTVGNHAEMARIARTDPERAARLDRESKPPAGLPFSDEANYSALAKLSKMSPEIGKLAQAAGKIAKEWSQLESKQSEAEMLKFIAEARKHGLKIETPQEQRRAADRKRMRDVAPFGSEEQDRRQKAAALASIRNGVQGTETVSKV
jgi:hypothetical protein